MNKNMSPFESLIDSATDYGRSQLELYKLKAVDKTADIVSSFFPSVLVTGLLLCFIFFLNLGIAIWLGKLFGELYLGFLALSAFYCIVALILHLFFRKGLKRIAGDYLVRSLLK
jgi:hypothetical protein